MLFRDVPAITSEDQMFKHRSYDRESDRARMSIWSDRCSRPWEKRKRASGLRRKNRSLFLVSEIARAFSLLMSKGNNQGTNLGTQTSCESRSSIPMVRNLIVKIMDKQISKILFWRVVLLRKNARVSFTSQSDEISLFVNSETWFSKAKLCV